MPDDKSAMVIPFGKHRGATVAEVLAKDPAYADWLMGQNWLVQRFAELHAAIASRGAGADDTPEHNAIQARFLDPAFRAAFALAVSDVSRLDGWDGQHGFVSSVAFEQYGVDVVLQWGFHPSATGYSHTHYPVEIKPSLGDDYPSVMRQMERLHPERSHIVGALGRDVRWFRGSYLLIDRYAGSIPLETVRGMFSANGRTLITVAEVEVHLVNAKILLESR